MQQNIHRYAGLLVALACLLAGCTSVHIPSNPASRSPERVALNLEGCAWDFPGASAPAVMQAQFTQALGEMVQLSNDKGETSAIKVANIRIEGAPRAGVTSPIIISILSTPLWPLMFIRNNCVADLRVSYTLADPAGKPGEQRQLREAFRGGYGGWSFLRFAFRSKVKSHIETAVPRVAAELLAADLKSRSGSDPKLVAANPPKAIKTLPSAPMPSTVVPQPVKMEVSALKPETAPIQPPPTPLPLPNTGKETKAQGTESRVLDSPTKSKIVADEPKPLAPKPDVSHPLDELLK